MAAGGPGWRLGRIVRRVIGQISLVETPAFIPLTRIVHRRRGTGNMRVLDPRPTDRPG